MVLREGEVVFGCGGVDEGCYGGERVGGDNVDRPEGRRGGH